MKKITLAILAFFAFSSAAFAQSFSGAMIHKAYQTFAVPHATVYNFIPFSNVEYDTGGFFNPTYPTRLTVPSGFTWARLCGQLVFEYNPNGMRQLVIKKNYPAGGGWYMGVPANNTMAVNGTTTDINACTPWIVVQAGDYFEIEPYQDSGVTINVTGGGTFFSIEVRP